MAEPCLNVTIKMARDIGIKLNRDRSATNLSRWASRPITNRRYGVRSGKVRAPVLVGKTCSCAKLSGVANDDLCMKQHTMHAAWLKGYHWEDLANLHVELRFLRHRLILSINDQIAQQGMESVETLDKLAQVDELLCAAGDTLEKAKTLLFNICYDRNVSANKHGKSKQ